MNKYIENRVLKEATYLLETNKTIREIAKIFSLSKSTVHKDLQERLPKIHPTLNNQVLEILNEHLNTRHIKGGEATKRKYQEQKVK